MEKYGFSVSDGLSEDKLIQVCAHECLHFIWFEKWKELYPNTEKYEYESPYLPWKYSEMVTDPILNSSSIKEILNVGEKSYDIFYTMYDNDKLVMDNLISIYNSSISIEEKIRKGYTYVSSYFDNN